MFKEMNRSVPLFVTLFVPLVKYRAACGKQAVLIASMIFEEYDSPR
jgi:hypothetical protein